MKDDDFCQMLLYSLINLICFLLTVIFLTALYNVHSQLKLLHLDVLSEYYSDLEMYQNSYTATATLFAFNFLGFVGFMGVLLLLINKNQIPNQSQILMQVPNQSQIPNQIPNNSQYQTQNRLNNNKNIQISDNNQKDRNFIPWKKIN